ncbi:hypothetical protein KY290_021274, partial [Solanum tuberosum]
SQVNLTLWDHEKLLKQFLKQLNTMSKINHRLRLIAMNLEDEVLAWHQAYLRCRVPPNVHGWDEYLRAITETFGDNFSDPMLELKKLRQTRTVREFRFAFSRLLTECNLTTAQAILCFLGGLKDELVGTILTHEPQILSKLANARSQRASGVQGGIVRKQHQETFVAMSQPTNYNQRTLLNSPSSIGGRPRRTISLA